MALLTPVFGKNAEKVQTIFEAWVGYAETFSAANDGWTESSTLYKQSRAKRLYRAGTPCIAMHCLSHLRSPHPGLLSILTLQHL